MRFMNEWDIEDAQRRFRNHAALGPATQTLANLRNVVNANSDGWPYWSKPVRSAAKLMELIEGDGTNQARQDAEKVTAAQVRKAYTPIKAFLTRSGLTCEIVDPR